MFSKEDLIYAYTRAQAIADSVLVDVTSAAKEAGYLHSVALTHPVWCRYVEVPEGVEGQDEQGRLWDILCMLRHAIRNSDGGSELLFSLHVRNDNRDRVPPLVNLKAVCGPDDQGLPCLTIMLPDED